MMNFRLVPSALVVVVAVMAIAMHAPGHFAHDSIMHLYEAMVRKEITWFPVFTSALLAWLGGGTIGSSAFVALNVCGTYGAYALAIRSLRSMSMARALFCCIILINPLVFMFVGAVLKDILFGTWVVLSFALCLTVQRVESKSSKFWLIALIAVVLGGGGLSRQQVVFMAPIFLLAPLWIICLTWEGLQKKRIFIFTVTLFFLAWFVTLGLSKRTIVQTDNPGVKIGLKYTQMFDIGGIVARLPTQEALATFPGLTAEDDQKIRELYTPDRVDFMFPLQFIEHLIDAGGGVSLTSIWIDGIRKNPVIYLRHRISSFISLLDLRDLEKCAPVYVGIGGGPPHQLYVLKLQLGADERATYLYSMYRHMFANPISKNWFYVIVMALISVALLVKKNIAVGPDRLVTLIYLGGMWCYVLSFIPLGIACDVRYLYPIIPTVMAMLMAIRFFETGAAGPLKGDPD